MNQLNLQPMASDRELACADLVVTAEKELSAFLGAVRETYGSQQAELSAEDWLHELATLDSLPASTREWRTLTYKAATRLAGRVGPQSPLTESQLSGRRRTCVFSSPVPQAS